MSIKSYFRPKNTNNIKLDKLEAPTEIDKLGAPAELDKLEAPLPTLEVPRKLTRPAKLTIKRGRGRP